MFTSYCGALKFGFKSFSGQNMTSYKLITIWPELNLCLFSYLPPLTSPLLQMADMDKAVSVVTTLASRITRDANPMPAWPTTHDILRNSITPNMFSTHRTCNHINPSCQANNSLTMP